MVASGGQRRRPTIPARNPNPPTTASIINGRCSTASDSRRPTSLLSFTTSLPNRAASDPIKRVPLRKRSATSVNAAAIASPALSAARARLAEPRAASPLCRSKCFSSARTRRSISAMPAAIARWECGDIKTSVLRLEKMRPPQRPRSTLVLGGIQPIVDLAFGLILGVAVTLLQTAGELLTLAFDHVEVVARELAPLLLHLALELLPIAFNAVPVHPLLLLLDLRFCEA